MSPEATGSSSPPPPDPASVLPKVENKPKTFEQLIEGIITTTEGMDNGSIPKEKGAEDILASCLQLQSLGLAEKLEGETAEEREGREARLEELRDAAVFPEVNTFLIERIISATKADTKDPQAIKRDINLVTFLGLDQDEDIGEYIRSLHQEYGGEEAQPTPPPRELTPMEKVDQVGGAIKSAYWEMKQVKRYGEDRPGWEQRLEDASREAATVVASIDDPVEAAHALWSQNKEVRRYTLEGLEKYFPESYQVINSIIEAEARAHLKHSEMMGDRRLQQIPQEVLNPLYEQSLKTAKRVHAKEGEIKPAEALGKIQHYMSEHFVPFDECMDGVLALEQQGIADKPAVARYLEVVAIYVGPILMGGIAVSDATLSVVPNHVPTRSRVESYLKMAHVLNLSRDELFGPQLAEFTAKYLPGPEDLREVKVSQAPGAVEPEGAASQPVLPEHKRQLITQAIALFEGTIDGAKSLKFADRQFIEAVTGTMQRLQAGMNNSSPMEVGYRPTLQIAEQITDFLRPKLRTIEEEAERLGISEQSHQPEIEALLKQAAMETDPQKAAGLAENAFNVFNQAVGRIIQKREEQGLVRKGIARGTEENETQARSLYQRLTTQTGENLQDSVVDHFRRNSLNLANIVQESMINLSAADKRFLDEVDKDRMILRRLIEEIIKNEPAKVQVKPAVPEVRKASPEDQDKLMQVL